MKKGAPFQILSTGLVWSELKILKLLTSKRSDKVWRVLFVLWVKLLDFLKKNATSLGKKNNNYNNTPISYSTVKNQ